MMRLYYSGLTRDTEKAILDDFLADPNGILVVINETRRNAVIEKLRQIVDFDDLKTRVITQESATNENFIGRRTGRATMPQRRSVYVEDIEALLRYVFEVHEVRSVAHSGVLIDLEAELES